MGILIFILILLKYKFADVDDGIDLSWNPSFPYIYDRIYFDSDVSISLSFFKDIQNGNDGGAIYCEDLTSTKIVSITDSIFFEH